jgi:flagellar hook-associated protein 1 FlgK
MSGLSSVMDTSLSAMFAAQMGLATTSHNIANAGRLGYTRQTNVLAARRALNLPSGAIGTGVDVVSVRRSNDEFLQGSLRAQVARLGSYTAVDSSLVELEQILGSVGNDHLGTALTSFFTSWSELANPPTDPSGLRQSVLTRAESLVTDFHNINESLDELERNIEIEIRQEIETLNSLLTQIGDLNGQIMAGEIGGQTANDLRDQRDLLVSQVAEIAEVSIHDREDGSMDLILNGRTMITRQSVQQFTTQYEQADNGYRMTVVTQNNLREVALPDGHLKGLLESRDTHVSRVRDQLDAVVKSLVTSVNALHSQGRSNGGAGLPFFVGDSLHSIDVSEAIRGNPDLIATSRSGEPGDSDIAREIGDLANFALPGESQTIGDLYRSTLIDLASKRGSYEFLVENQNNAVGAVEAKIASVGGVSLDEEGANMLRYQNSYAAAAKMITTVQEMFDSLLNMI